MKSMSPDDRGLRHSQQAWYEQPFRIAASVVGAVLGAAAGGIVTYYLIVLLLHPPGMRIEEAYGTGVLVYFGIGLGTLVGMWLPWVRRRECT